MYVCSYKKNHTHARACMHARTHTSITAATNHSLQDRVKSEKFTCLGPHPHTHTLMDWTSLSRVCVEAEWHSDTPVAGTGRAGPRWLEEDGYPYRVGLSDFLGLGYTIICSWL